VRPTAAPTEGCRAFRCCIRTGRPCVTSSDVGATVADHLPGLHAQVSLAEALEGDLTKAFSVSPEFDLCICTLGSDELARITEIVKAVARCMRRGGKIIAFHANFAVYPIPVYAINAAQGVPGARIYFAGSEESAPMVRRFHRLHTATSRGRVSEVVRRVALLTASAFTAFAANRREGAIPETQWSDVPAQCTSITVELTV
jgi:hypothetical protein